MVPMLNKGMTYTGLEGRSSSSGNSRTVVKPDVTLQEIGDGPEAAGLIRSCFLDSVLPFGVGYITDMLPISA